MLDEPVPLRTRLQGCLWRDVPGVRVRLREASRLLQNPQASVSEVAYAVGFNDMSYFSRMFKRHFGVAPSSVQLAGTPPIAGDDRLIEMPPLLLDQTQRLN